MSFLCVHMNRIINGLCEVIIYCNYYLQFNLLSNYLLAVSSMKLQLNCCSCYKISIFTMKKGFISLTNYLLFLWNRKFLWFFLFFDSFSTKFYSCYLCNSNNNLFLSTAASIMQRKALGLIRMKCLGIPF